MKKLFKTYYSKCILISLFTLLLVACGSGSSPSQRYSQLHDSAPKQPVDVSHVRNAVPKVEPHSHYGNPSSYVVLGKCYHVLKSAKGYVKRGIASWYGTKFNKHLTSNREIYNMYAMTAANKSLPLPTYVQVTNLKNGKKVIVKVNDRGPFKENRVIDLSYAAAKKLDMLKKGTAYVEVKAIDPRTYHIQKQINKPKLKIPGNPQLYLQVAALKNQIRAQNLASQITRALGEKTYVTESMSQNHQPLYKVQIGPIANVDASDRIVKELYSKGLRAPVTIIK